MAIYWCDPYIESPSGGVHGTTGSGTAGSYSNPYSIDNLPVSGYSAGDEIRLKALPTNAWITGPAWHFAVSDFTTYNTGQYGVYFTDPPAHHSFIKYTTVKGDEQYINWGMASQRLLNTYPGIWTTAVPYADATIPCEQLDPQYYLSNLVTPSKTHLLSGQQLTSVTLTAGWVSETARGGETIIQRVNPTASTEYWFGQSTIANNQMTVDAPELTISHSQSGTSKKIYIYGETVELHDINMRNTHSSSNRLAILTALTFKANCVSTGGYVDLYGPYYDTAATQGVNRDIKSFLLGYWFEFHSQGNKGPINLKFKNLVTYYYEHDADDTLHLSYYDDFYFKYVHKTDKGVPTEMAITSAVNKATTPPFRGADSLLGPSLVGTENSYREVHSHIKTNGQYLVLGGEIDVSNADTYFRDFIQSSSTTLENTTQHFVTSADNYGSNRAKINKAWGVDRNSGRRVAFAPTNSRNKEFMLMYNSTEYGGKLVYHLMPHDSSAYDRIHLPMPTGVSEITSNSSYRLKITLGGTTVGTVNLLGRLEGNSTSASWSYTQTSPRVIDASSGGSGAVVYSNTFSGTQLYGAQQLTMILILSQPPATSYSVAKICIDSVELEVV